MLLAHFEDGKNIPLTDCNKTLGPMIRRHVKKKNVGAACLLKKINQYYHELAYLFYLLPRFFPLF